LAIELNSKLYKAFFSFVKTIHELFECFKMQGNFTAGLRNQS